jgi:hypothetical protein
VNELANILFGMLRRVDWVLRWLEDSEIAEEAIQPILEKMEGFEGAFN